MIDSETTVIILNGPPSSGKSTIFAPILRDYLFRSPMREGAVVLQESFAAPMKVYISLALGVPYRVINKNQPLDILNGFSVREFLIAESEQHMKPRYGQEIFGRLLIQRLINSPSYARWVILDDGGFEEERAPLLREPFKTITVAIRRPGYDFRGDSRRYLSSPNYNAMNDGDVDRAKTSAKQLALAILDDHG